MNGAPMQWRSGGDKARRVARRDASQLAASPRMDCQPTPEPLREVAGQDARRPLHRGGLLFGYFLLATQEKVTRSPKASESPLLQLFAAQFLPIEDLRMVQR